MVTDVEMGAINYLMYKCKEDIAKDILAHVQEMLGGLDEEDFESDKARKEFIQEFADGINDVIKTAANTNSFPKKTIGDYEVVNTFSYGFKTIFVGEDKKAALDSPEKYVVGEWKSDGILEFYDNVVGSNDYNEIIKVYSDRVQEQVQAIQKEIDDVPFDRTPFGPDSVNPITEEDLKGKIVVIKTENMKPEFLGAERQLCIATGGNGCNPHGLGTGIFCKNIYSGKDVRWERYDVLGIIKDECLPDWAKERFQKKEVIFTFGSSKQFPFQLGYVSIIAPTVKEAVDEFRRNYPDLNEGILNCSDYYYSEEAVANIKKEGNGAGCHRKIDISLLPDEKGVDDIIKNACNKAEKSSVDTKQKDLEME